VDHRQKKKEGGRARKSVESPHHREEGRCSVVWLKKKGKKELNLMLREKKKKRQHRTGPGKRAGVGGKEIVRLLEKKKRDGRADLPKKERVSWWKPGEEGKGSARSGREGENARKDPPLNHHTRRVGRLPRTEAEKNCWQVLCLSAERKRKKKKGVGCQVPACGLRRGFF